MDHGRVVQFLEQRIWNTEYRSVYYSVYGHHLSFDAAAYNQTAEIFQIIRKNESGDPGDPEEIQE